VVLNGEQYWLTRMLLQRGLALEAATQEGFTTKTQRLTEKRRRKMRV
jgi:hypothetical protein